MPKSVNTRLKIQGNKTPIFIETTFKLGTILSVKEKELYSKYYNK